MSLDKSLMPSRSGQILSVFLCILMIAGCQVRPLYSTAPDGSSLQAIFPAIDVQAPDSRIEQVFRNDLLFGLRGGSEADTPRYELAYQLRIIRDELAVEEEAGTPTTYELQALMPIQLIELSSGRVVMEQRMRGNAFYDRSTQEFANIRARRDAENRLAAQLAERVQGRLATFFASQ